jgi:hypothetical protein
LTALKEVAAGWVEIGGRSQPSTEASSSLRYACLRENAPWALAWSRRSLEGLDED